jgi:hypothetical protein
MDNDVIVDISQNDNITVVIDTEGPNLYPISDLIENLLKNYNKINNAADNLIANSAIYLNPVEVQELSVVKTLTGTWEETKEEMNTIQYNLSAAWQNTTDFINTKIFDAGFF